MKPRDSYPVMTPDQMADITRRTIALEPRITAIWWSPSIVCHADGTLEFRNFLSVTANGGSMGVAPDGEVITPEFILERIDRRLNPGKYPAYHAPRAMSTKKSPSPHKNLSLGDLGL